MSPKVLLLRSIGLAPIRIWASGRVRLRMRPWSPRSSQSGLVWPCLAFSDCCSALLSAGPKRGATGICLGSCSPAEMHHCQLHAMNAGVIITMSIFNRLLRTRPECVQGMMRLSARPASPGLRLSDLSSHVAPFEKIALPVEKTSHRATMSHSTRLTPSEAGLSLPRRSQPSPACVSGLKD